MRYVTYKLSWNKGMGTQPYTCWAASVGTGNAVFEGGITSSGGPQYSDYIHLGYASGDDAMVTAAIAACVPSFNMQEITAEAAILFYAQANPDTVNNNPSNDPSPFVSGVSLDANGRIVTSNSTWIIMDVPAHIAWSTTQLKLDCDNCIFAQYPQTNQTTLILLLMSATQAGNTAAASYIKQVWTWASQTFSIYYSNAASLATCTTHAQIATISWMPQLVALVAQDPGVTISAAMGMLA